MRIGIDARALTPQKSGIENYLRRLVEGFQRIDRANEYWLFSASLDEPPPVLPRNFHWVVVPHRRSGLLDTWLVFALPPVLRRIGIELFYCPINKVPLYAGRKVVTVHGLEWRKFAAGFTLGNRLRQALWMQISMRLASGVIAVSENTRRDIVEHYPQAADRVEVIHEGVDHALFNVRTDTASVDEVRSRLHIDGPFLLVVSLLSPRKNTVRLFEAFRLLRKERGIQHELVLVGKEGWLYDDVLRWLEDHPDTAQYIRRTGFIADADLACLYNAADLLVYPSLYEGFGLPLLEAMACGLPVVAANAASLPEVLGDAGVLVNPVSVEDIADGIASVLSDPALHAELRKRGLARAATFSWDLMTQRVLAHFERVAKQTGKLAALEPMSD